MLKAKWFGWLTVLMLLVSGSANAAPPFVMVEGSITAVSAAPPAITVGTGSGEVTLGLTAATRISAGTAADLVVGTTVKAKYDRSTLNALQIIIKEVAEPEVGEAVGVVLSADPTTGVVSIDVNDDDIADLTLNTDARTEIKLGSLRLSQAELDLLLGQTVKVEYDAETFLAEEIKAEATRTLTASGTVSAVDAAAGTLTLETASGPLTFEVVAGTDIRVNGKSVTLDAILVGDAAQVSYLATETGNVVLRINVAVSKPKHVTGTLTAVTTDTLTVTSRNGTAVTLTVGAQTDIRINGRRVDLPALLAALDAATAANRTVKISAQYLSRGGVNLATRVQANVKGGGQGRGRGGR